MNMEPTRKELVLAMAVLMAFPVFAEIALRVCGAEFGLQLYAPDRERGWVIRPGATSIVDVETRQFVRINSHGFHDREWPYDKRANTVRIAVLGNSWTEALQVPVEKNYTAILEQKLNAMDCFFCNRKCGNITRI